MKEHITIADGLPKGFKTLYWINDYKQFGVMMEQMYNPFTDEIGIHFKKGDLRKSIFFSSNFSDKKIAKEKFLEIEKEFGIPLKHSKYQRK